MAKAQRMQAEQAAKEVISSGRRDAGFVTNE